VSGGVEGMESSPGAMLVVLHEHVLDSVHQEQPTTGNDSRSIRKSAGKNKGDADINY